MTGPWIVDTNVLVAGLITRDRLAPTARIQDAMLAARFPFLLSVDLLTEYRCVLLRPKLRGYHGLDEAQIDVLLEAVVRNAAIREPALLGSRAAPDPRDAHLWALLEADPAAVLITGDGALLTSPPRPGAVCTPAAFVHQVLDTMSP